MRSTQNFDTFIKEEIENYAPEVSPQIWDKIIAERSKRKPAGFWFKFFTPRNIFLISGVLVIASGAAIYSFKNINSNNNSTILISNPTSAANQQSSIQTAVTSNSTIDPQLIEDKNSNLPIAKSKAIETSVNAEKTNNETNTQHSKSIKRHTLNATTESSIENKNLIAKSNRVVIIKNSTNHIISKPVSNRNNNISNNNKSSSKNTFQTKNKDEETLNDFNTPFFGGTLLSRLQAGINNLEAARHQSPAHKQIEMKAATFPGCPTIEKESKSKQYVEMYAGPDFIFRSFSDTPNSTYLIKRKESTHLMSAYSAGLRYTKVYKNGLSFKTGINFSQINEKFTFVLNNFSQVTYTTDPITGDTTGSFITRGNAKKNTYNHYRSIDLPVMIGYEIGNGNLHVNFNAGAIINIYSWQKGEVIGINNKPVNITTGKASSPYQYKTNIGLGLTAGVSMYYQVTDYLHLMFEPNFRYNLSPVNKNNISLKQKNNALGLRLGVRIDLK